MSDFFTFYLGEHRNPANRALHLVGTSLAAIQLGLAIGMLQPWFLLSGLVTGYLFAWVGHAAFEKNRPATFKAPLKSFSSDWRMWGLWIAGRLKAEMIARGVSNAS